MNDKEFESIGFIRRKAEQFRAVLELELYDVSQATRDVAGHTDLAREFSQLTSLQTLQTVDKAISSVDPLTSDHRTLKMLHAWLVQAYSDHEVLTLDQEIAKRAFGFGIKGPDETTIPLRDIRLHLAATADADERQRMQDARVSAATELHTLMRDRLGIFQDIAHRMGHKHYRQTWASTMNRDVDQLRTLAETVLKETEDMYRESMGWNVRKHLGISLEDARRFDMPYLFAARHARIEESFTAKEMVSLARSFLQRMGIKLECGGRLSTTVNQAPGNPYRVFVCAPRVPDDVRLVVQADARNKDLGKFLVALGRALFQASISPSAQFEDRVLGDGALDITFGRVFGQFMLDKEWLRRILQSKRDGDYLVMSYVKRLFDLRQTCARVIYEFELYGDKPIADMPDRFVELFQNALKMRISKELYIHEVNRPFLSVVQLRGRLFETLYTQHLQHYFEKDWWHNPQTGPFLKQEWSQGRRLQVEQRAQEMGYDGLTVRPTLKLFLKNL